MKIVMMFDLPEENSAFEHARRGADWMNVVDDMVKWLRDRVKYDVKLSDFERYAYTKAYEKIWEIQKDYALSVWTDDGRAAPRESETVDELCGSGE